MIVLFFVRMVSDSSQLVMKSLLEYLIYKIKVQVSVSVLLTQMRTFSEIFETLHASYSVEVKTGCFC